MPSKILIIEDEDSIRILLSRFLQRKGFETILAEDGLEGVEIAKKVHPDLIILDVIMPRMDGLTAGRLIKNYKPLRNVPMIFLTAACEDKDIKGAQEAQADVFIMKPFDVKKLIQIVNELLSIPPET